MRSQEIFVSLDIGTTSIKVVVAEAINGRVNIIGVGNEKSRGLSRGVIVDIDETVYSIQQAVAQAERKAGVKINEVVVGVPSNQLAIEECHGMIAVSGENREITYRDVENVIAAAKVRSIPPEREIISIIPEEFIVDGFNGIRDPRGMIGVRLELYARLITGPKTIIHNIRRCVQKAGLYISEFVLQPQAISQVAINRDEREFGTVIIDMGGGQTSASILYDNQLKYSFVDQEGGDFVTKDISVILNTSLDSAERIKREYGYSIASQTSEDEYFPVETVGKKEPVRVDEHYLAEIIEARLAQIFETIREDLARVDALDLPGGFVLTGGGSALPGVIELAKRYFGGKVRMYVPEEMGMRNPVYTTGLGLVEYVSSLDDIHRIAQSSFQDVRREEVRVPRRPMTREVGDSVDSEIESDTYYDQSSKASKSTFSGLSNFSNKLKKQFASKNHSNEVLEEESFDDYSSPTVDDQLMDDNIYYEEVFDENVEMNKQSSNPATSGNVTDKMRSFFETFFD